MLIPKPSCLDTQQQRRANAGTACWTEQLSATPYLLRSFPEFSGLDRIRKAQGIWWAPMKKENLRTPVRHILICSALIFGAGMLSGCVAVNQQTSREQILANQRRNCSDYGFKAGTDAFAKCMQTGINERRRVLMAAAGMQSGNFPAAPANPPQAYYPQPAYNPPPPVYQMQPYRASISCTTTSFGGSSFTNCS